MESNAVLQISWTSFLFLFFFLLAHITTTSLQLSFPLLDLSFSCFSPIIYLTFSASRIQCPPPYFYINSVNQKIKFFDQLGAVHLCHNRSLLDTVDDGIAPSAGNYNPPNLLVISCLCVGYTLGITKEGDTDLTRCKRYKDLHSSHLKCLGFKSKGG